MSGSIHRSDPHSSVSGSTPSSFSSQMKDRFSTLFQDSVKEEGAASKSVALPLSAELNSVLEESRQDLLTAEELLKAIDDRTDGDIAIEPQSADSVEASKEAMRKLRDNVHSALHLLSNVRGTIQEVFNAVKNSIPSFSQEKELTSWIHEIIEKWSFDSSDVHGFSMKKLERLVALCQDISDKMDIGKESTLLEASGPSGQEVTDRHSRALIRMLE